jgi:hypothetical protein
LLERCRSFGLGLVNATATVVRTLVRDTMTGENGLLGDGMVVANTGTGGELDVTASRIENSARAGLANFGAAAAIGDSQLACNAFHLDGETLAGHAYEFTDRGGNACGCGAAPVECQVLSSNLEPPDFGH